MKQIRFVTFIMSVILRHIRPGLHITTVFSIDSSVCRFPLMNWSMKITENREEHFLIVCIVQQMFQKPVEIQFAMTEDPRKPANNYT